jgi:hypothetical protein
MGTFIIVLLAVIIMLMFFVQYYGGRESMRGLKVIGGKPVDHKHVPYFVRLVSKNPGSNEWQHRCGGTLISNKHVLTASHCLRSIIGSALNNTGEKFAVEVFDSLNRKTRMIPIAGMWYRLNPRIETWKSEYSSRDIAVIKLRQSVRNAVTLKLGTTIPKKNDQLFVVGRGILRDGDKLVMPDNIQIARLRVHRVERIHDVSNIVGDIIVAKTIERSACPGDSGGPLLKDGMVYGVVSGPIPDIKEDGYHIHCEKVSSNVYAGQYTAVAPHVNWIKRTMRR